MAVGGRQEEENREGTAGSKRGSKEGEEFNIIPTKSHILKFLPDGSMVWVV